MLYVTKQVPIRMKHYCRLMAKLAIYSKVVIHHKILLMLSGLYYFMCISRVG